MTAATGPFAGRYVLGQPGVLGPLGNTSAGFDGASGELAMPGSPLGPNATLEGWFRWRSGTTVLRDTTDMGGEGWLLAFATAGKLAYRLGGQGFNTGLPIETVRDGEWHHIAATKNGGAAALYVDGELVHSAASGAGSQPAVGPWHVMRNGTNAVFSGGEADEVALYTRALGADEVGAHFDLAKSIAATPLPGEPPPPAAEPPLAGTGPGGGVLGPAGPLPPHAAPWSGARQARRADRPRRARPAQRPRAPAGAAATGWCATAWRSCGPGAAAGGAAPTW